MCASRVKTPHLAASALRRLGRAGLEALPRSAYADGASCSEHHFPLYGCALKITVAAQERFEKTIKFAELGCVFCFQTKAGVEA